MDAVSNVASQGGRQSVIDWGIATVPMKGETESGDRALVKILPYGCIVAAVDGLGHGDEAATAAKKAIAVLETFEEESIISLMKRCHEQLRNTRGAVISLAFFNSRDETMTWLGVGNVEGVLIRSDPQASPSRENILLRAGVVGYQLPQLFGSVIPISKGDTLIFATDGIYNGFAEGVKNNDTPRKIAVDICQLHKKELDDALAVVVRYVGLNI
jgi:phosphoserine phosphatase RsbX